MQKWRRYLKIVALSYYLYAIKQMQQLLKDNNFKLPLFCECQYNIEIQLDLSELRFANFHLEGKCSLAPLRDIRLMLFLWGQQISQDSRELDPRVLFRTEHTGVGPLGTLPLRTHGSWTSGYSSAQGTRELDLWVLFRSGHRGLDLRVLLFFSPRQGRAPVECF